MMRLSSGLSHQVPVRQQVQPREGWFTRLKRSLGLEVDIRAAQLNRLDRVDRAQTTTKSVRGLGNLQGGVKSPALTARAANEQTLAELDRLLPHLK